ncbi:extracellular solute-binding protein [Microbacterium oryzae]|uniref:ABC transporter substrate-binding protein n=1 Tax=Microbacterium oryzae TaxID=743009 RepID=UPI0025AFDFE0|nr:extracellular solute-binding protein [Microbacterium oryzae]MDN3310325.1 extracellular solute-binding protein [Microbacterium oryzae]
MIVAGAAAAAVTLTGCGAGSRTTNENSAAVACDYTAPESATTVNVLAYNSSAIDPFTDTMVESCSIDDVTLVHDPIDFAGQVTKTTATLSGDTGTYDIIENYGFAIPAQAAEDKLVPLDDLFAEYSEQYDLDALSESMLSALTFDGTLYALPMQGQMFILAYREDVFDELGLEVPTTFDEMISAAQAIQDAGTMDYPIALPWLATSDVSTSFEAMMNSLGSDFVDADGNVTLDTDDARTALEAMTSLVPYMDPQVLTFDQPSVQQQMYNGTAAMSIMFSGRMNDLMLETNSEFFDDIAFAAPPKANADAEYAYNRVSIDGWSIPFNTGLDHDMLFQMIASSVGEDASAASVPAAYPAREGMVTDENSPYGEAANESIVSVMPPVVSPILADVTAATRDTLAAILMGDMSIEDGVAQMQAEGETIG